MGLYWVKRYSKNAGNDGPNKANRRKWWDDDKTASSGILYSRYVENSSKLVKITGILEGLKDMNASQMSLEEYMNYMGPIWELNQKYRGAIDELEDLQFCVQVLGIMFAGMGMIHALTSTAIIDTVLDVVDAGISFVLGDYAGFAIGGISILLPEIFESGLKTAKKTLKSGDDILEVLSKKEKQALLDKLDDAGITNVTKVEMGSDGVKIHSASGVIDAKWTDEIVEGTANLTQSKIDEILAIEQGLRPNPSTYLSDEYIARHLSQFDEGVTKIAWANPTRPIGPPGGTFVMPKSVADNLIKEAGGDVRKLEELLGLNVGDLGDTPVRIDIDNPSGLRMPDGNELGANKFWTPGGYTSGGIPEATIDQTPLSDIVVTDLFK